MKLLQSSIVMFKSSAEFYTILYTNEVLESMYKYNSDFEVWDCVHTLELPIFTDSYQYLLCF